MWICWQRKSVCACKWGKSWCCLRVAFVLSFTVQFFPIRNITFAHSNVIFSIRIFALKPILWRCVRAPLGGEKEHKEHVHAHQWRACVTRSFGSGVSSLIAVCSFALQLTHIHKHRHTHAHRTLRRAIIHVTSYNGDAILHWLNGFTWHRYSTTYNPLKCLYFT